MLARLLSLRAGGVRLAAMSSLVVGGFVQGCGDAQEGVLREARLGAACDASEDVGRQVGDRVQDFSLRDAAGNSVLLSDYCGQVVYVQMSAMWCPSCASEVEKFRELEDKFEGEDLVILNLVVENTSGDSPTPEDLLAWASNHNVQVPVLADPDWKIWERYFDAHATPRSLLVDRNGRLAVNYFIVREAEIEAALKRESFSGGGGAGGAQ